jgi:tetratricopeptide (TPR) repeat protein
VPAAASLRGATTAETRGLLSELAQAHLLAEHSNGRYTMHDLLRAYAVEQARDTDEEATHRVAVRRLLEHYLHSAHAAAILLYPPGSPLRLEPQSTDVTLVGHADTGQANSWFTAERPALLAAVQDMRTAGLDEWTGPLAWAFGIFLDRNGHWTDQITVNEAALAAARRLSDPAREARALRGLVGAHTRLGRYDEALALLSPTIKLLERLGDQANLARAYLDVGQVFERLGRHADALTQDQLALTTLRKAGIGAGQAIALNAIAWCHTMLGHYDLAAARCDEAIALHRETDDPWSLAATLDTLGYVRQHSGDHAGAVEAFHRAIELWHEAGDRTGAAETLTHLGDSHAATGNLAAARHAWQDAFDIYQELAHPSAAETEARLLSSAT